MNDQNGERGVWKTLYEYDRDKTGRKGRKTTEFHTITLGLSQNQN